MSTPIIVLAGQSNANRLEIQRSVATYASDNGAIFINYGVGGTPLSASLDNGAGDWSGSTAPGAGELRMELEARIDAIMNPESEFYISDAYVAGVVWVQGEGDQKSIETASAYSDNLVELRDYFVNKYGEHEWIVSALSSDALTYRNGSASSAELWMTVRSGQLALASQDGFTIIDPDAVAQAAGVSVMDMFDDDYVHYALGFQPVLANALVNSLDVVPGDINLLVGTTDQDRIYVPGGMFTQVYGAAGSDIADFSRLTHGINVDASSGMFVDVSQRHGDKAFSATLVEVEQVQGTDFRDYMVAGGSTIRLLAEGGDDVVIGSEVRDVIFLGDGNDRGFGNGGSDFMKGGAGDDLLKGGDGDDTLYGEDGEDNIQGGDGDDFIFGGRGDDRINPQDGADTIIFGRYDNGDDRINGFDQRTDVLSFEGLGLDEDDFAFSVSGRDLHISVEGDRMEADIVLINRANINPEVLDASVDWILV